MGGGWGWGKCPPPPPHSHHSPPHCPPPPTRCLLIVHNKCDGGKIIALPSSCPTSPMKVCSPPPAPPHPQNKKKSNNKTNSVTLQYSRCFLFTTVSLEYTERWPPEHNLLVSGGTLASLFFTALCMA